MKEARVWDVLSQRLRGSAPYRALRDRLGESVRLPVPAAAWVGELLRQDLGRRLLVLVPHESDAMAWVEAARLFGSRRVLYFPAPSLTPYQEVDVSLQVRAQEAVALDRILAGEATTVVCTPRALFRRLPPAALFLEAAVEVRAGEEHAVENLAQRLSAGGYRRVDLVGEVGDFAVRGGVFDVFPPGEGEPLRLDLFGDTVESIRRFDPLSQRSGESADSARLLPLGIFPAGAREADRVADALLRLAGEEAAAEAAELAEKLRRQVGFPGWENYLPLLVREAEDLAAPCPEPAARRWSWPSTPAPSRPRPPTTASACRPTTRRGASTGAWRCRPRSSSICRPMSRRPSSLRSGGSETCWAVGLERLCPQPYWRIDFEGSSTDLFHGQLPRFPREVETARARGERFLLVGAGRTAASGCEELLEGREVRHRPRRRRARRRRAGARLPSAAGGRGGLRRAPAASRPVAPLGSPRRSRATDRSSPACATSRSATTWCTPTTASASSWHCAPSPAATALARCPAAGAARRGAGKPAAATPR